MHLYLLIMIFSLSIILYGWNIAFAEEEGEEGLFLNPIASAVDSKGFVYIVDNDNHTVQKFDSNGKFLSMWKTKNVDNTMFEYPIGIAVDSSDNVYVVDRGHSKIKKLSDSGYIAHSFGKFGYQDENGDTIGGEFSRPSHIAIDSQDNIYITDYGTETIQKFSNDGMFILKWGSNGLEDGQFTTPLGIATDSSDNVYVLDEGINDDGKYSRIQKFSQDGKFLTKWGSYGKGDGQFLSLSGIAIGSSNTVYIVDFKGEFLQKFTSDGEFVEKISIQSAASIHDTFSGTTSVSIDDSTGNFYITNGIDKHVSKFSPEGILLTTWGGEADWNMSRQTEQQDDPTRVPDNGVYSKDGLPLYMLEKNQDVDIIFHLNPAMQENATKATMTYFIETHDDEILDTGEMIVVSLDSSESKQPIVVPFSWSQNGSYFLRDQIEYVDDDDYTWAGHSGSKQFIVVGKFSKAINDEGVCKKESLIPAFKRGFSSVVCVSHDTSYVLYERWWDIEKQD